MIIITITDNWGETCVRLSGGDMSGVEYFTFSLNCHIINQLKYIHIKVFIARSGFNHNAYERLATTVEPLLL